MSTEPLYARAWNPSKLQWSVGKPSELIKSMLREIVQTQRVWRRLNPDLEPREVTPEIRIVRGNSYHRRFNKRAIILALLNSAPDERVTVINWDIPF